MLKKTVTIHCPMGLQVEPAGRLCDRAVDFKSKIILQQDDRAVNAKSILSILGAVIRDGETVQLICDGPDEDEAIECITDVLEKDLAG